VGTLGAEGTSALEWGAAAPVVIAEGAMTQKVGCALALPPVL